jgi:hypothetical protein
MDSSMDKTHRLEPRYFRLSDTICTWLQFVDWCILVFILQAKNSISESSWESRLYFTRPAKSLNMTTLDFFVSAVYVV